MILHKQKTETEYWYRYDDSPGFTKFHIRLETYAVLRHTDCGVKLYMGYGQKEKFVLNNARKRFAYPTKKLAWDSFVIRKAYHVGHLKSQLNYAEQLHTAVKDLKEPPNATHDYGLYVRLGDNGDEWY